MIGSKSAIRNPKSRLFLSRYPVSSPVAPEPAQRIRQEGAPAPVAVEPPAEDELVVLPPQLQGLGHLLLRQRPVAVPVPEMVCAVPQYYADRCLPAPSDP